MIPIVSDLISNTVGKVINGVVQKYLPASMSEKEKAEMQLEIDKLMIEEEKILQGQIESINATMREEVKSDHWIVFSWRPLCGFTFSFIIIYNYIFAPLFSFQIVNIPGEVWNALLVILGASAITRGWEKIERTKNEK